MNPLVSVIIPAYNREKHIKRAIESILAQSFNNFEIIIVDDGSVDNTKKVIDLYVSEKKVLYFYQQNQGVSSALNNGIRKASGKYIAILHSDDFWIDKQKLEKQVNFLDNNKEYVLVGGGIIRIKEDNTEVSRILYPQEDGEIRESILSSCLFASSAVMFKKDTFEKVGGFDENLETCEDWDLWMRMGKMGKFHNVPEYFTYYQESNKSLSNSYYRKSLKYNILLAKKNKNNYPYFAKAITLRYFYYIYSFLPFKNALLPLASKVKQFLFGKPAYSKN